MMLLLNFSSSSSMKLTRIGCTYMCFLTSADSPFTVSRRVASFSVVITMAGFGIILNAMFMASKSEGVNR